MNKQPWNANRNIERMKHYSDLVNAIKSESGPSLPTINIYEIANKAKRLTK